MNCLKRLFRRKPNPMPLEPNGIMIIMRGAKPGILLRTTDFDEFTEAFKNLHFPDNTIYGYIPNMEDK